VLQLEVLYRLLDGLRVEAIQATEQPSDDNKNAFGFGQVSGMLRAIRAIRERIEEAVEEANQQDEEQAQG
jgi:hypothetical protein